MPFDCQSPQTPFLIHFPCVLDQGKNQDSNWGEGGGQSSLFKNLKKIGTLILEVNNDALLALIFFSFFKNQ